MIDRLHEYPLHTASVVGFIMVVWLGIWAARKQILENPGAHRTLLTRVAVVGLGITVLGGLPLALVGAGWLHVDETAVDSLSYLSHLSGMFGGPGYVALFGLLVSRHHHGCRCRSRRSPRWVSGRCRATCSSP